MTEFNVILASCTCSYLHYGLLAARAEILKASEDSSNPCLLVGYDGMTNYFIFKRSDFAMLAAFLSSIYMLVP